MTAIMLLFGIVAAAFLSVFFILWFFNVPGDKSRRKSRNRSETKSYYSDGADSNNSSNSSSGSASDKGKTLIVKSKDGGTFKEKKRNFETKIKKVAEEKPKFVAQVFKEILEDDAEYQQKINLKKK